MPANLITALALGHGAVTFPPPRNAIDRDLAPWNGPVPVDPPSVETHTGWCPVPGDDGFPSGKNGQACFYFSNGCTIGCDACDGTSRGPIPSSSDPFWHRKFNQCPNGTNSTASATICDPAKRTVNTGAACGADDDWYFYSPWRRPGSAPVFDSCGLAGGHPPPACKDSCFGGLYVNTSHASLGDAGSALPRMPAQAVWRAGELVNVSWVIEANHGGGYIYRLCPADQPLTEECFNKVPLEFEGSQMLRWGGPQGTTSTFVGTYVGPSGTEPSGAIWARNPIPRNDVGQTGEGFPPPCANTPGQRCEGMMDGASADPTLEIIDTVRLPKDLAPGRWVLGWRWDCEESNQIWMSCSDVEVVGVA